jgi:polyhydroxybutyrate depolymerase
MRARGAAAVVLAALAPVVPAAPGLTATAPASMPPGDYLLPLASGGIPRQYLLHVPAGYDGSRPMPLVLVFHGTFGNAYNIAEKTGLSDIADREGFVVAYPQSAGVQWNDGRADSLTAPPVDDVAFVEDLVDHLGQTLLDIDERRVYATGLSSGGMLSYRLGVELSDRIAAIAPVAAVLDESLATTPSAPVAAVAFHGTDDDTIRYDGRDGPADGEAALGTAVIGGPHPSVPDTIRRWVDFNHCREHPAVKHLRDLDPDDGTRVVRFTHSGCDAGADVVLYRIDGGGHAWPGDTGAGLSATRDAHVSRDVNASEALWQFFADHPARTG